MGLTNLFPDSRVMARGVAVIAASILRSGHGPLKDVEEAEPGLFEDADRIAEYIQNGGSDG